MLSWSSGTGRTGVLEQQERSECRPGVAGQVEMSSRRSRTGRNVVQEQMDTVLRNVALWTDRKSSCGSRISRNVVRKKQNKSKCRPEAAGYLDRNVVREQQGRSKCLPRGAEQAP